MYYMRFTIFDYIIKCSSAKIAPRCPKPKYENGFLRKMKIRKIWGAIIVSELSSLPDPMPRE